MIKFHPTDKQLTQFAEGNIAATQALVISAQDTPFLLMDRSASRTYIAQSALIGSDGIDKTGARPLYEAESDSLTLTECPDEHGRGRKI